MGRGLHRSIAWTAGECGVKGRPKPKTQGCCSACTAAITLRQRQCAGPLDCASLLALADTYGPPRALTESRVDCQPAPLSPHAPACNRFHINLAAAVKTDSVFRSVLRAEAHDSQPLTLSTPVASASAAHLESAMPCARHSSSRKSACRGWAPATREDISRLHVCWLGSTWGGRGWGGEGQGAQGVRECEGVPLESACPPCHGGALPAVHAPRRQGTRRAVQGARQAPAGAGLRAKLGQGCTWVPSRTARATCGAQPGASQPPAASGAPRLLTSASACPSTPSAPAQEGRQGSYPEPAPPPYPPRRSQHVLTGRPHCAC